MRGCDGRCWPSVGLKHAVRPLLRRPRATPPAAPLRRTRLVDDLARTLRAHGTAGATIVYVNTVKETEAIAETINSLKIPVAAGGGGVLRAEPYHGQLPSGVRMETHKRFVRDDTQVVVATTGAESVRSW